MGGLGGGVTPQGGCIASSHLSSQPLCRGRPSCHCWPLRVAPCGAPCCQRSACQTLSWRGGLRKPFTCQRLTGAPSTQSERVTTWPGGRLSNPWPWLALSGRASSNSPRTGSWWRGSCSLRSTTTAIMAPASCQSPRQVAGVMAGRCQSLATAVVTRAARSQSPALVWLGPLYTLMS
ncbi:hypothetical protein D3C84_356880 [compost metagenome]